MKAVVVRKVILGVLLVGLITLGIRALGILSGHGHVNAHQGATPEHTTSRAPQQVVAVHPRYDPELQVTVRQLAMVEPYYQANLKARASGIVRFVAKDIGDHVRRGELLIQIDAPELEKGVEEKEAIVDQRRQELALAQSQIRNCEALIEVARATVSQRQAESRAAQAAADYRQRRLARFRQLSARQAINADLVDEQAREAETAAASVDGAQAALQRAKADLVEKQASREQALAEVELRRRLISVAQKDLEQVRTVAGFAQIVAPFEGVVIRRNIDPGDFVHDATGSSTSLPLMSLARTDMVTVTAKVADNAAPFVGVRTPVSIRVDDLPGAKIRGQITRVSPLIESGDRTMRVEVDLFNGDSSEYQLMATHTISAGLATLGGAGPFGNLMSLAAGRFVAHADYKGDNDHFPAWPGKPETGEVAHRLLPGMTSELTLELDRFVDAHLLPSTVVFSKSGKRYIMMVEDGQTRIRPVRLQVDDGRVVKLVVLEQGKDGIETPRELSPSDLVVASRQQEVGEGQPVTVSMKSW